MGVQEDIALRNAGYSPAQEKDVFDDASSLSSSQDSLSIFSDQSDTSSQSSTGDSDLESFDSKHHQLPTESQIKIESCVTLQADQQVKQHQQTEYADTSASCWTGSKQSLSVQPACIPQHPHPRRSSSGTKKPPPLPRQDERKVLFVNDLVDSATTAVETIWPLSNSCSGATSNSRGVLPLRRYIEETLRRSRTSYSTLQVALYYLILIKPHVPTLDFTMEQPSDDPSHRALQCGRRMFLAALILASKYLQDRNYSAKAWSKMSGLKTCEINGNERCFLKAVNWKLHIPDLIFKRWTEIVLRYTSPQATTLSDHGLQATDNKSLWKQVIPILTADLDDHRLIGDYIPDEVRNPTSMAWSTCATPTPARIELPLTPPNSDSNLIPAQPSVPFMSVGHHAEPLPPTPLLARWGPLPTPQMTPSLVASNTPAVSACSSRRPSITRAMSHIQASSLCQMANEIRFPCSRVFSDRFAAARTSYGAPAMYSSGSSPESMITDSTRSSRSSSISSMSAASTSAPCPAPLARLATCRKAGFATSQTQAAARFVDQDADMPIPTMEAVEIADTPSPVDKDMTPVPSRISSVGFGICRKRGRSRPSSSDDSELQANVRDLLRLSRSSPSNVSTDQKKPESFVKPCSFRQAWQSLSHSPRPDGVKALQPPCALRRETCGRVPIPDETGRKRTCFSATYGQSNDESS